jgi:hypothetical protein
MPHEIRVPVLPSLEFSLISAIDASTKLPAEPAFGTIPHGQKAVLLATKNHYDRSAEQVRQPHFDRQFIQKLLATSPPSEVMF